MMVSNEQDPGPPASDAAWQRLYDLPTGVSSDRAVNANTASGHELQRCSQPLSGSHHPKQALKAGKPFAQ